MNQFKKPVLSIITVVFNAQKLILKTIESVWEQTYPHIEYIIIDGASTDGTLSLLNHHVDRFSILRSEPDKGIYDAMNKGLSLAIGDYILFLNAGDELSGPTIVEAIFDTKQEADLYYGDVILIESDGTIKGARRHKPPLQLNWKSFRMGMMVSHQAFIPARHITDPFRTDLKISADIDWCISCMKKAHTISNTNLIISKYLIGGLSRQRTLLAWRERFQVMKKHYGPIPTSFYHVWILLRFVGYYLTSGKLD